jgi:transcriptional regulator with XRE-family HTH domain
MAVSHHYTPQSLNAILRDSNLPAPPYAFQVGFNERLIAARKAKGYSQEALGKLMGEMSKQGISHWETGRYEPNIAQLTKLCEVLGCSADWLLLGQAPEGLPPDAMEVARIYARLTPEGKKNWKTVSQVFVEAVSDATLEKRMPAVKKPAPQK